MYERSAASTSSSSVPVKQEPGSTRAIRLRELTSSRFSVRFYLVAVLFILFDVEMVFMMPWAVIYRQLPHLTGCSRLFGFWEMLVYLGFVAVGLYYIVRKGILNWSHDKADL